MNHPLLGLVILGLYCAAIGLVLLIWHRLTRHD
jgi:hypothetical protein